METGRGCGRQCPFVPRVWEGPRGRGELQAKLGGGDRKVPPCVTQTRFSCLSFPIRAPVDWSLVESGLLV